MTSGWRCSPTTRRPSRRSTATRSAGSSSNSAYRCIHSHGAGRFDGGRRIGYRLAEEGITCSSAVNRATVARIGSVRLARPLNDRHRRRCRRPAHGRRVLVERSGRPRPTPPTRFAGLDRAGVGRRGDRRWQRGVGGRDGRRRQGSARPRDRARAQAHARWKHPPYAQHPLHARGEDEFSKGSYLFDELWKDLCNVGDGPNDEELARITVGDSETMPAWMDDHGARWQKPLHGTLHLDRTNRFFLGGGKALLNAYYREAAGRSRITVVYDAKVEEFDFVDARCTSLVVAYAGARHRVRTRAVVCASGGFEANLEWLARYWGDAATTTSSAARPTTTGTCSPSCTRPTPRARGRNAGSTRSRSTRERRSSTAASPPGSTRSRSASSVNQSGQRFYDEGEDIWPKRYATWGRLIAEQPGQIATAFWDSKVNHLFLPPMYGVTSADTIAGLASALDLDPDAVSQPWKPTTAPWSMAARSTRPCLDDCHTRSLTPEKTHWAQRLDRPPYYGIAMRPGITFTYMGVAVEHDARVDGRTARPSTTCSRPARSCPETS